MPSRVVWRVMTLVRRTLVAAAMSAALGPRIAVAQATPVGLWNTISDTDGQLTGIVEIREDHGEYVGIVRGILVAADPADSVCGKCPGELKGQRIVGLEILRHMRRHGDEWSGGEILDPETGKTYRAKMKLAADGQKLVVRGYIGVSLFGRSQTWLRRP